MTHESGQPLADDDDDWCGHERDDGALCTRAKGHKDDHEYGDEDEDEVLPPLPQQGEVGSWKVLFDGLAQRAQVLVEAGWVLVSTEQEESWEYGNSVFWDLERNGIAIELEFYEHGQLVAYPMSGRNEEEDEDIAEPYFSIYRSTLRSSREAFDANGWV